jgi:hypothetical protein
MYEAIAASEVLPEIDLPRLADLALWSDRKPENR